ncbi:MAG: chitobiase/beta-hexosaminidase C-terminal domain-containing protein [Oscillospiraceae bacterium]|nr:chitobiase/beta-hexosaminidase C-terminal domain-containing protein [Oscillospiraceae bacterium]
MQLSQGSDTVSEGSPDGAQNSGIPVPETEVASRPVEDSKENGEGRTDGSPDESPDGSSDGAQGGAQGGAQPLDDAGPGTESTMQSSDSSGTNDAGASQNGIPGASQNGQQDTAQNGVQPPDASNSETEAVVVTPPSLLPESATYEAQNGAQDGASGGDTGVAHAQESPNPGTMASPTPPTSPTPPSILEPEQPIAEDDPIVLTIKGNGVRSETHWTLADLMSLPEGYREIVYSTTNNWPSFGHTVGHGISLPYLLRQAGITDAAASIKFTATDGYYFSVTYNQVFGTQYAYAVHEPGGSSGRSAVVPMVSWEWGDVGRVRQENLRVFFGQNGPNEVNSAAFVSNLSVIEVSTAALGTWAPLGATVPDGSIVAAGTEVGFLHDNMDSVRIYYTLDGSVPTYDSAVYNPSASHFQPQLTVPFVLTENVTIRAFAAGLGRDASAVVSFSYIIE